ncbi:MAG: hypothetical protein NZM06_04660, partial [Chloroherpetonaceae bacterium]|nr:hypothetical protein [Chloroherpetonaceae bacterium]
MTTETLSATLNGATVQNGYAQVNPLRTKRDFDAMRKACEKDLGKFHGDIAKREIHWFDPKLNAWIAYSDEKQKWTGFDAK